MSKFVQRRGGGKITPAVRRERGGGDRLERREEGGRRVFD
jgi:hypothetical protein